MSYLFILASFVLPFLMILLRRKWNVAYFVFNVLALVSLVIFGNISSVFIYRIIRDSAVFTTNIHGIFLNPFFLATGAYLGIYLIYQLMNITFKDET